MLQISKIVITGGPCGGKSTAFTWIKEALTKQGYTVLLVSETATELITGGIAPWRLGSNVEYQKLQLELQLEKEKIFERAALKMKADKVIIVCDRGAIDNKAYMTEFEFEQAIKSIGKTENELRDSYDAVFHLVTAAYGAEKFYTTENNWARTETPEEARRLDDKVFSAWNGHSYHKIIENDSTFEDKMKKLIKEISDFLGL